MKPPLLRSLTARNKIKETEGKMKRLAVLALIVAGLFPSSTVAQEQNVQTLLDNCNSTDAKQFMYCLGYIGGASDVMVLNGGILKNNPSIDILKRFAMCPPSAITYGASRQAFVNWAKNHPEAWTQSMALGVVVALRDVWPCPL